MSYRGRSHFVDDAERQCVGKAKYPDKARAKKALKRSRSLVGRRDDIMPYRCPHCSSWHLGHKWGRNPKNESTPAATVETRYTSGNEATTGGGEVENGT